MWLRNNVKQRHHQRGGGREVFGFGRDNRSGSGDEANKDEVFAAAGGWDVTYFPPTGRSVVGACTSVSPVAECIREPSTLKSSSSRDMAIRPVRTPKM
jgi:hypothetical protein